ncbi:MAG: HD domain-containing protein [Deltaproteobacteria bacterium]|nr:HD domain-containing protein [Deltaproteobacteria bacterium]
MKCPGQDSRYWTPEAIFETKCPECGHDMEFFKDESARKCKKCGHKMLNPKIDFGCASYCKYAEQCLGEMSPDLLAQRDDLLKDRVAVEMKRYFGSDFKRIGHAGRVARYAERIGRGEKGNLGVILTTAYLHDIGIKNAEKKYNSTAPKYQHLEGPPVAREILTKLGAKEPMIDEVCEIVSHHHHPRSTDTVNFKSVYDADMIVNLEEKNKEQPIPPKKIARIIDKAFLTATGRETARSILLGIKPSQ